MHILLHAGAAAQTGAQSKNTFIFFPKEKASGQWNYYAGLSMAQLPEIIVEDVFDQVPMIELKLRYGFPYNVSVNGDLSTNGFTNLLTIAPAYSVSWNKFSAGIGNEFLLWYGFFKSEGFNVSVLGWGFSPYVSVGYDFEDFLISVKAEANIKAQNSFMRGLRYIENAPKFTGISVSLAVEQPLWGSHQFALGFKTNYTYFFYKSWLSFSSFEQYTLYPEFFIGFIF
jgi:hypothetical protein